MTKEQRLANLAEQIITTVENNTKAPGMCAEKISRYRKLQKEEEQAKPESPYKNFTWEDSQSKDRSHG